MLKVVLCRGIPASGKSSWAKQFIIAERGKWKRVNKDDLRAMLDVSHYSKANEAFVVRLRDHIIVETLREGKNVIVDDTNLNPQHEESIKNLVLGLAEVEIKWFPISVEEAIYRDSRREASVGETVIRSMYKQYQKLGGPEPQPYQPVTVKKRDPKLPDCILSDMDGTLANFRNHRGPYDQERCDQDECVESVATAIDVFHYAGCKVIIMSGRDSKVRSQTLRWLDKYGIPYDALYMREEGDNRKDEIIKAELFDKYVAGKYNVLAAFDDRPVICRLWKSKGIYVFKCGSESEF